MQQEKIWEYYQTQAPESFAGSQARLAYLVRETEKRHLHNILNIGIGAGILEQLAQKRGLRVSSVDPTQSAVDRLCERLGIDARVGYVQHIPFEDAVFDAVIVSEVLEHLDHDTLLQALQEIKRVLVPGGYIVGTVPYREDLTSNIVVCPHCGEQFHRWGHLQSFSIETMRDALSPFCEVDRITPRLFINFPTLNWKGRLLGLLQLLLWQLGIRSKGRLVFVARKGSS